MASNVDARLENLVPVESGLEHHGDHEKNHATLADGETVADENLAPIPPLMYQHGILSGTYHFGRSKPGDGIA